MSQTPRTPERNRQQEHPSTPATISQTLRAGAVAVVTAPLTVPRGFLRYLGLITSGDASSTDPAVQQLNFELEGESRSAAGIESAEIARPAGINVAHGNGADSARQRTTDTPSYSNTTFDKPFVNMSPNWSVVTTFFNSMHLFTISSRNQTVSK